MADQWDKDKPAGSDLVSDIDTLIQANNEALDRLLIGYRNNVVVRADTTSQIKIGTGEIAIPNAGGTIVRYRRNTAEVTATAASDLDSGTTFTNSTAYYVYATADVDETSFRVKLSESSTAPGSITYFRKIGSFFVDSSGFITSVGNTSSGGPVVQEIRTIDSGFRSITTSSLYDIANTPTTSAGGEYTQLQTVVIPNDSNNLLHIRVTVNTDLPFGNGSFGVAALFKNADASAIAAGYAQGATTNLGGSGGGGQHTIVFDYVQTAGTTDATTFKIRGSNSSGGTWEVNGNSGSQEFGGIVSSSMVIRELAT